MLSATGDEKRDAETLKNTIRNQEVPKVSDKLTKPKPERSLKINLDNNVTYGFQKLHSVAALIHPRHKGDEIRKTLD